VVSAVVSAVMSRTAEGADEGQLRAVEAGAALDRLPGEVDARRPADDQRRLHRALGELAAQPEPGRGRFSRGGCDTGEAGARQARVNSRSSGGPVPK
jgi:hypothetical protein